MTFLKFENLEHFRFCPRKVKENVGTVRLAMGIVSGEIQDIFGYYLDSIQSCDLERFDKIMLYPHILTVNLL